MTYGEWKSKFVKNPGGSEADYPKLVYGDSAANKAGTKAEPAEIKGVSTGHNVGSTGRVYRDEKIPPKDLKSVDNSGGSGIIGVGSDDVALENQRYGRNKDTLVNKTYIESGEYRKKFDKITDNPDVNKTLYDCAKKALKHRSGTVLEDMYWINGDNGKIIYSVTDSTDARAVVYTEKIKGIIKKHDNMITLHTHPGSMPPSIADFNSNQKNLYTYGVIACHNGKVFTYKSNEHISETLYDMYTVKGIKTGLSEYEAQIYALTKLKENYDIDFQEVL